MGGADLVMGAYAVAVKLATHMGLQAEEVAEAIARDMLPGLSINTYVTVIESLLRDCMSSTPAVGTYLRRRAPRR